MKDIREVEPGVWSVLDGSRSFEVRIAGATAQVNGRAVTLDAADPRAWNPGAARKGGSGTAQVKAPMPGKVVRVLVSKGDVLKQGDGVIIVEAMKMQNELKAPKDGEVTAVLVKENETVNAGAVLVTLE